MANEERRQLIAILEEVSRAGDMNGAVDFIGPDSQRLRRAVELVESKHIDGSVNFGPAGEPATCDALGLTTRGREYLGTLKEKEHAASLRGFLEKCLPAVGTLALTLLGQYLGGCLRHGG